MKVEVCSFCVPEAQVLVYSLEHLQVHSKTCQYCNKAIELLLSLGNMMTKNEMLVDFLLYLSDIKDKSRVPVTDAKTKVEVLTNQSKNKESKRYIILSFICNSSHFMHEKKNVIHQNPHFPLNDMG